MHVMMKIYQLNKKKITLLIAMLILIFAIGVVVVSIFVKQGSIKMVIWCSMIGYLFFLIRKAYLDYNAKLIIDDFGLESVKKNEKMRLEWRNIKNIEYQGINSIPMFDILIIHGSYGDKIYIDYNFNDYRSVWYEVIEECRKNNTQVLIDQRIIIKLSL